MKYVVAVVPARGGSKSIPQKNIIALADKPLIHYSLEAALLSPIVDYIILSTDCDKIAEVSAISTRVNFIKRPDELATDTASTYEAVYNALEQFLKQNPHISSNEITLILLQPTSPLRNHQHISEAFELFQSRQAKSLFGICEEEHSSFKNFIYNDRSELTPLFTKEHLAMPRQKLPTVVRQNGAIYIINYEDFCREKSFYAEPAIGYMMDKDSSVDIDNFSDLEKAEAILAKSSTILAKAC